MPRSSHLDYALLSLALVTTACSDDVAIGQPCLPANIPCDARGENCGFRADESYLFQGAESCETGVCIVHSLYSGQAPQQPADPRVPCTAEGQPAGCVTQAALEASAYCSCRCSRGDGETRDVCTCGDGYVCELGFAGAQDAYCVKRPRED